MARSRRTSNPVTLFPFLAVLLCTIGALVLMLVVVSAGIRKEAVAIATAKHAARVNAPNESPRPGDVAAAGPHGLPLALKIDEDDPQCRPISPLLVRERLPSPIREASPQTLAELAELERLARQLDHEVSARAEQLQNVSVKSQALRQQLQRVKTQQDDLQQAIIRTANLRAELDQESSELKAENQQIIEWLDESRKLINSQQKQLASPVHSIVPYDGQTGTVRRPIIIECSDDVVRFEAERVEIPISVLRKFSPDQNPLRSGVQALFGYWMARDQLADPGRRSRKPYALILVRPSGAEAFSTAVFALEDLIGDFGYELVEAEFKYELPDTTPDAVRECLAAVEAEIRRGPIRSPRVLSPDGPIDISRVARGPAASRSFFGSDDFRNRRSGSSDAGDGADSSVADGSRGASLGGGLPGVSKTNLAAAEQQLRSGVLDELLAERAQQGNSLLQSSRLSGLSDGMRNASTRLPGNLADSESGNGHAQKAVTTLPRWLPAPSGRSATDRVSEGETSPLTSNSRAAGGQSIPDRNPDGKQIGGRGNGSGGDPVSTVDPLVTRGEVETLQGPSSQTNAGVQAERQVETQIPASVDSHSTPGATGAAQPGRASDLNSGSSTSSNSGSGGGSDGSPDSASNSARPPPSQSNLLRS
ncbi:MAG: hypothetical protein O3B86_16570, partial [Planctomycetota bacterium]|nr:hypothetical protein [Planctomycetota bacterium]